jgi:hypothetical protein
VRGVCLGGADCATVPAVRALGVGRGDHDGATDPMNENFSLIVMCLFLLGSLAFLAEQLTSYH